MVEKIANVPLVLFLLVGIAIGGMNYMNDISTLEKLQNNKANIQSQLNEKEGNLKKAKNASLEIPALKSEIEQLTLVLSKAELLAPKDLVARMLIDEVTREAKFAGVRITQSKPSSGTAQKDVANQPLAIQDIGLDVDLEGSYSQMTFFFNQLAKSKIIILPKDFNIAVKEILDNQVNLRVSGTLSGVKYLGVKK